VLDIDDDDDDDDIDDDDIDAAAVEEEDDAGKGGESDSTTTTRLLPLSEIYMLPDEATATPQGHESGRPSGLKGLSGILNTDS